MINFQYRFGGYQLPKIQLDETGPSYYVVEPHPYYRNQPLYWQKGYRTSTTKPDYYTFINDNVIETEDNGDKPPTQITSNCHYCRSKGGKLNKLFPLI